MKRALIVLTFFAGCSAMEEREPLLETTGQGDFTLAYTDSGDALRVSYNSERCEPGGTVITPQEFIIPVGVLEGAEPSILELLIKNVADIFLLFGSGFWIGTD